ncbi:hypothetical protein SG64_22695 [Enterobacter hormaechei subsp. xiangfangensis]|nr:hypothetical protein SG64_22695 [Enterobacter hormaechei subsp. xiangfangensis]
MKKTLKHFSLIWFISTLVVLGTYVFMLCNVTSYGYFISHISGEIHRVFITLMCAYIAGMFLSVIEFIMLVRNE